MRKGFCNEINFSKKKISSNKSSIVKKQVVNLADYREALQANSRKTILLVNEDKVTLSNIKASFEAADYNVISAKDGMEVSKIIEDTALDAVIVNIQLPWLDGYELCSLLKSSLVFKKLPVVLLSRSKSEEDVRKGFDAGCDDYISEPLQAHELRSIVSKLMA